ncbi:MAG: hypothetical protein B9S37_06275 [Verrucomicrobiia bacterium Tous-C3TDCM]|nr:MAG: hypothetical protein B9S37_06275 [Verrucomicrobiae bacterium Tous-C3TDCM]PAZ04194.1 MAG: hypothetical protein CAK88_12445 [Verrucomicrobiae bacterium AMD-G2]
MNCSLLITSLAIFCLVPVSAIDFVHEVSPILKKHCADCHMGDKHKGGFAMNTREELMRENDDGLVLALGNSKDSLMMHLILSEDEDERMPPKGDGLNEKEIATIAAWINAGAPWEPGFTFKKKTYEPPLRLNRPVLPAAQNGRTHPLDRIIDAHLTKNRATAPITIEEASFARRVHLDIVGLLPDPTALQSYLADADPAKREKLVAKLLENQQDYASHWMSFWNDLLRNDYVGTGYIDGGRSQISAWLYQSLFDNKPYNRFASELIAPDQSSAGFANGIKWRGEVSAGQTVPIQYAQSVGQTFLGINLKCASCHDSFTDQWKLTDSYGLAAAFSADKIEIARCDKPTGKIAEPYWLYPELGKIDPSQPPAVRLKQVAELTTMPANGRFSRTVVNRLWHRLMGRGIVHPVDAMDSEPWNATLLDYLAIYLVDNQYDLKKVIAHICSSQAYQSKTETLLVDEESKWKYAGPRAKRMTAEQFVDAIWRITGTAPPQTDFAPPLPSNQSSAARASWIWINDGVQSPAGETIGLKKTIELATLPQAVRAVITCDNQFILHINGKEVARSDNWMVPQVLDLMPHLRTGANEIFVLAKNAGEAPNGAGFYFQAHMQQAEKTALLGSDDSWIAAVAPSGTVAADATWQPAVKVPNQNTWNQNEAVMQGAHTQMMQVESLRVRAALMKSDLLMRSLGRPNREQIVSSRPNDLTTLEAMDLNNGNILASMLERGSDAVIKRFGTDPSALVDGLYVQALSRLPSAEEKQISLEVLGATTTPASVQDFLWSLFMLPEFQLIR